MQLSPGLGTILCKVKGLNNYPDLGMFNNRKNRTGLASWLWGKRRSGAAIWAYPD